MYKDGFIKILGLLKQNAMFRLSLTSKELFHSNFWAWLIGKYENKFTSVFYPDYDGKSNVKVRREKQNFDLSLEINDKLIIIENKFKSLPDKEQLEKYIEKAKSWQNKEIILISYMPPTFEMDENKQKLISYKELHERFLKVNFEDINSTDKSIIENYIECIGLLVKLQECTFDKVNNLSDFWEMYEDKEMYEALDEINFGLTFQKIFLYELIDKLFKSIKLKNLKFQIMTGNSHIAYIDLYGKNPEAFITLCVNGEYRYMFCIKKQDNLNKKEDLINYCDNNYKEFLSNKNCKQKRVKYNCFMDKNCAWIYQKKDIEIVKKLSFNELADTIEKDLSKLENYKSKIKESKCQD